MGEVLFFVLNGSGDSSGLRVSAIDSDDFSEIALENCAQRRQDRLDIASGR